MQRASTITLILLILSVNAQAFGRDFAAASFDASAMQTMASRVDTAHVDVIHDPGPPPPPTVTNVQAVATPMMPTTNMAVRASFPMTDTSRLLSSFVTNSQLTGSLANSQLFSTASDGVFLVQDDTVVETKSPTEQLLVKGRIFVDTAESGKTVDTPVGQVLVGAEATASVEVVPGKSVVVTALSCAKGPLTIVAPDENVTINEGEKLVISLSDEDLICAEGNTDVIQAGLVVAGHPASRRREFIQPNNFQTLQIAGTRITLGNSKSLSRLRNHMRSASTRQTSESIVCKQFGGLSLTGGIAENVFADNTTKVAQGLTGSEITFDAGNLVCDTQRDFTVKTSMGDLVVKKGTVVDMEAADQTVRCRVCAGAYVSFDAPTGKIKVLPGSELVLSGKSAGSARLIPCDGIARRNIRSSNVGDVKVSIAEFNITTVLLNSTRLNAVCSRMEPSDRKDFVAKVSKMAVITEYIGRNRGGWTFGTSL